jgi:hypothetical protein
MNKFKVSEELAQIFIKNEFIETTEKFHPQSYEMIKKEGYNPEKMCRAFQANNCYIVEFLLNEIRVSYTSKKGKVHERRTELTEDELRSIIAFNNLPGATKTTMQRKGNSILELYKEYYEIKENPIDRKYHSLAKIKAIIRGFEFAKI